jgi:long-chain acyl-CoA synthetase
MAGTLIGIFIESVRTRRKPVQFMRRVGGRWEAISGEKALGDVASLAHAMRALGVERGDRVAILSENRYEWALADLATLAIGAVTVPVYPTLTGAQVRHILADSEAKVVFTSTAAQLAQLREQCGALPALGPCVVFDEVAGLRAGERSFAELMRQGASARAADPAAFDGWTAAIAPDDLATIIYTSGTTGEPKGAMLTHDNIASNVRAALEVVRIEPTDSCLSFLPLCHIFERMAGMYSMFAGGATIAYAESIDTVARDAMEVSPTLLNGVPRFYEKVYARVLAGVAATPPLRQAIFRWGLEQGRARARSRFAGHEKETFFTRLADRLVGAKVRERVGGRLRLCVSGGAPLAPHVMEFFFAMGIPVIEGYGLTETSPVITLNRVGHERPGSVGQPFPGVEVKIGQDGEVMTRGPHVMRGYWRNEAATREVIRDGWFHTGDAGRIDDDGYLYITDRIKDLLVLAAGKKVAPQPIEAKIKQSPWIAEAMLLGDCKPFIVALIVPDFAKLEAEAEARGWTGLGHAELIRRPDVLQIYEDEIARVNADLAQFETIKRFDLLDRELTLDGGELTPTLKLRRRIITQRLLPRIEALYAGHEAPAAR